MFAEVPFVHRLKGLLSFTPEQIPAKHREIYETIKVDGGDDIASSLSFVGPSPVFLLPPEMLTLHGAHKLTSHPFTQAIAEGPDTLRDFYATFSPANLAQMYGITAKGLKGEDLAPWQLPWLSNLKPPSAEVGLGIEHGVSYYGPCSPQKIAVEHQRLTSVTSRIKEHGYLPDENDGHIEGHFLQSGRDFRFFVRGGKHRAAALTYLGFARIPVRVRLTWPKVVSAGAEEDWPLVRSGEIDRRLAARIFDRYFHD